jgi:uncharacterized membrane-anchored protein
MRFLIKVDGSVTEGEFQSAQEAFEATATTHPEARSIGVFCLRDE